MPKLFLNGKEENLADLKTVQDLLDQQGLEANSVAIALNGSFVPRSEYLSVEVKDGDELEVLVPMQGG